MKNLTVDEYVQALEKMKKSPRDRVGILGELGVSGIGTTAGFALSGTIAGAVGATTFLGSTHLAAFLWTIGLGGLTTVSVGWVVGAAVAGGSLAYFAGSLIRSGGKCDTIKKMTIREVEQRIQLLRQKARSSYDHDEKMKKVLTGIQYLVATNLIKQEKPTELLVAIEKRQISIDEAFELIQGFTGQGAS